MAGGGFNSGEFAGGGTSVMLGGTGKRFGGMPFSLIENQDRVCVRRNKRGGSSGCKVIPQQR